MKNFLSQSPPPPNRFFSVDNGDKIRLWLNGEEVTRFAYSAFAPEGAGVEGFGAVYRYTTDPPTVGDDGQPKRMKQEGVIMWMPQEWIA